MADAERLFRTNRYEIVICDLLMPTTCGTRMFRQARLQPEMPVVFVSGEVAVRRRLPYEDTPSVKLCRVPGTPIVLKDLVASVEEAMVSVRHPGSRAHS
ncbi:hypothetical protein GMLC_05210 [Geomonas limicola]|uniref:Response regulatory domain-containing protein n=2 Tax=Geomonas limicola TaxID=2740186 RepID=A0A6V8N336_9BACT|nr:hypothetical protein GMLC_05210 [Geomonas limicola]